MITCGIVGLPNVGKSTLFNALLQMQVAQAANYAFCTIEPNIAKIDVKDARLVQAGEIANSRQTIFPKIEILDIAGLVKGASAGEGLGNKFLSNIRQVDAILHVLRCFENEEINHVQGRVDPLEDMHTVELELIIADLQSLRLRLPKLERAAKSDPASSKLMKLTEQLIPVLEDGKPAKSLGLSDPEDIKNLKMLDLLSSKPTLYICNVSDNEIESGNSYSKRVQESVGIQNTALCSAQVEFEISVMSREDKDLFMAELGINECSTDRISRRALELLNMHTFFTVGPNEARSWVVTKGTIAPLAAGKIHSDIERGFIKAEVISFTDYMSCGGEAGAQSKGKMRIEGKDYVVQDADIVHFRFNV